MAADELDHGTLYYWHAQYQSSYASWSAWSDWSAETSFTTCGGVPWYYDGDGDQYSPGTNMLACDDPGSNWYLSTDSHWSTGGTSGDCDDTISTTNPGAVENCNGVDDDCNGQIDDGIASQYTYYLDADGDGFGDPDNNSLEICFGPNTPPSGYTNTDNVDCHGDDNADINPDASEVCSNSWDDDCDGTTDEAACLPAPLQPVNLSPNDGIWDWFASPTLSASVFSDLSCNPNCADADHQASRWRIATDAGFTSIVYDTGPIVESSPKTQHDVSVTLDPGTTYYWQVRYQDADDLWSFWSEDTSFTTAAVNDPPEQPTNVSPLNTLTGVSRTPLLLASDYVDSTPGGSHAASQWRISAGAGDTFDANLVYDSSPVSETTKTRHAVSTTLAASTTFHWQVRYQDSLGAWSDYSSAWFFTTEASSDPTYNAVAYWKLDNNTNDESGNSNHGTIYGDATWATGTFGNALNFDGTGDYVQIADSSSLDITSAVTLEAWIKSSSSTQDTYAKVVGKMKDTKYPFQLEVKGAEGNVISFFVTDTTGTSHTVSSISAIPVGVWTHVIGTYYGNMMRLYINGTLENTLSDSFTLWTNNENVFIGCRPEAASTMGFSGLIDEVAIYDWGLSGPTNIGDDCGDAPNSEICLRYLRTGGGGVAGSAPDRPVNVSPVVPDNTNISLTPTLSADFFSDADGDVHAQSRWEIRLASGAYGDTDSYGTTTAGQTTSLDVPQDVLVYNNARYYWHVQYQDDSVYNAWSDWSLETSFTTLCGADELCGNNFDDDCDSQTDEAGCILSLPPDPPGNTNRSPGDGAVGVSRTPTLAAGDFSDATPGDIQQASQWQISTSLASFDANIVYDTHTISETVKTRHTLDYTLEEETIYYWQVRYQDSYGVWSEFSGQWSFYTSALANRKPDQPTNVSPGNGVSDWSRTPTLTASAFTDAAGDTHVASQWQISFVSGDYSAGNLAYDTGPIVETTKTQHIVTGLTADTTFYWHVRYQDSVGAWSDYSDEWSFTTSVGAGMLGDGTDGDQPALSGTINNYAYIQDSTIGFGSSITVTMDDVSGFTVGNQALIIQMQHSNVNSAGTYEFANIADLVILSLNRLFFWTLFSQWGFTDLNHQPFAHRRSRPQTC